MLLDLHSTYGSESRKANNVSTDPTRSGFTTLKIYIILIIYIGEKLTYLGTPDFLLHDAAVPVVLHAPIIEIRFVSVLPPIVPGQTKQVSDF